MGVGVVGGGGDQSFERGELRGAGLGGEVEGLAAPELALGEGLLGERGDDAKVVGAAAEGFPE